MAIKDITTIFNTKLSESLKKLWILLLLVFITEMLIKFDLLKSEFILRIAYFVTFCLVFSWYFLINRNWGATIITFLSSSLFYLLNTDYSISFIVKIYSDGLNNQVNSLPFMLFQIIVLLITSTIIARQYLKETPCKINIKTLISTTLTTVVFLFSCQNIIFSNDFLDIFIESMELGFMINIIYSIFSALYLGSLIFTYYFLINSYQENGLLSNLDKGILKKSVDNFVFTFPIFYTAFILTILYNLFELTLGGVTYFYLVYTLYEYVKVFIILITPIIFITIISQILREKAKNENSFFGLFGALLYIPIINIVFYLLLTLNAKYKILIKDKIHTNKVLHIVLGLLLVILYYIYQNNHSLSDVSASEVITTLVLFIIGIIRVGKIWGVAIGMAILSFLFLDLASLASQAPVYFGEAHGNPLINSLKELVKDVPEFLIVIFVKTIKYATFLYILRYAFLTEEEWNE